MFFQKKSNPIKARTMFIILCGLAIVFALAHDARPGLFGEATRTKPSGDPVNILGTRVIDIDGTIHRMGIRDGAARPVVVLMLSPTCPISRRYSPDLNELYERARTAGVDFFGVFADPVVTRKELRAFRDEYKLNFPLLLDPAGDLSSRLPVRVTPEAFVINVRDRLTYRGRIDDRFVRIGKLRTKIGSHDLRDAIQRVPGERRLNRPRVTEAIGCIFEAFQKGELPEKITYNRHIAPIVQANCAGCHRPGGIGPFPLLSYKDVHGRSRMIGYTTRERIMPPWQAKKDFGHFRDERRLSDRQIELIDRWMKAGAPEGDAAHPPVKPRLTPGGWRLGKPDLVLTMPESFSVPAKGEDIYRYFVIPSRMRRDRTLVAIDFKPGDPSVVHHCNFFVDYYGRARAMDKKDPRPGFSVFGKGSFMSYDGAASLGAWAPGADPYRLPEGMGIELPAGGDMVFEIHYHLSGKATKDRSSIALYFAKKPVERHVEGLFLGTQDLAIPAGEKRYRREISMPVPAGMTLIDIAPHMHLLGREARVEATLPGGRRLPLIHVNNWDLRWQNVYVFREPVHLPAGSRIDARFVFDNSDENYANPHRPPRPIQWGWGTNDEMAELYLTMIPDDPDDTEKLLEASRFTWRQSAVPGAPKRELTGREIDASLGKLAKISVWSPSGERRLEVLSRRVKQKVLLARSKALAATNAKHPGYQTQHASFLLIFAEHTSNQREQYRLAEQADRYLQKALKIDPAYLDARLARAALSLYAADSSSLRSARRELEALVAECERDADYKNRPAYARAYLYLGEYYFAGSKQEARNVWARGLKRYPADSELQKKQGVE